MYMYMHTTDLYGTQETKITSDFKSLIIKDTWYLIYLALSS